MNTVGFCVLLLASYCLFGCSSRLPSSEASLLEDVNRRFDGLVEVRYKSPMYALVSLAPGSERDVQLHQQVFHALVMLPQGKEPRPGSLFVYVNFYNASGSFLFQMYYDPRQRTVIRSDDDLYEWHN
jgi:hypothetical protein